MMELARGTRSQGVMELRIQQRGQSSRRYKKLLVEHESK